MHRAGRILVQINNACTIIPYPTAEEKHIWQVYVTSELKKNCFVIYYTRRDLNFHICEKQIFKSFGCTEIATTQNEPKRAEPAKVIHKQFFISMSTIWHILTIPINRISFIYMGIPKMSFTFQVFTRVQGNVFTRVQGN